MWWDSIKFVFEGTVGGEVVAVAVEVLIFMERSVKLAIHFVDYALLCIKWRVFGDRRQWLILILQRQGLGS